MIRKLHNLLPILAAASAAYGAWEIYHPAGYLVLAGGLVALEYRFDRDDDRNRP